MKSITLFSAMMCAACAATNSIQDHILNTIAFMILCWFNVVGYHKENKK